MIKVTLTTFLCSFEEFQLVFFTSLVQQHHEAVSMCVPIEMSRNDMTVLPEDGDQPLVVALSHSSGVSGKGQVTHWYMGYNVHLQRGGRLLNLCSSFGQMEVTRSGLLTMTNSGGVCN